jgi:predicted ATPase/DNA-binding winged helix-turn-helix (wHTH) protein
LRRPRDNPAVSAPALLLSFGDFLLDEANARLARSGAVVDLPPKSFELLVFLARRPGELVLKDDLLDAVWGRRFVSEGAVKTVVSELRAALCDDAKAPRWIETVPKRGYRFIGAVAPAAPTPAPGPAPAGNLPLAMPRLFGREYELDTLQGLLQLHPLVTLTGPAGVGKTRLALAAAGLQRSRNAGGTWLIELAPLPAAATDAAALRSTLAQALRVAPAGVDSDDSFVRTLQGASLLVLLDNAEHVLDALAPWLAGLIDRLPHCRWLVTSREPLQLPMEQVLRVPPLALPARSAEHDLDALRASPAVELFVERVASRLPGFLPQPQQQAALVQLCRVLDGIPLALELAAARVPALGVLGLAQHLAAEGGPGAQLQLLTQGARNAAPHQRTLRAALDWSHELLTPPERRVFRRLAVFRGSFAPAAAQTVAADEGLQGLAVLDILGTLADKSMLQQPVQDGSAARFTLLESLREFALEQLAAAGELEAVQRRHLQATLAHWEDADRGALDEPAMAWAEQQAPGLDNLRAALRWGVAAVAMRAEPGVIDELLALVGASANFWPRAGLAAEGITWCRAVRTLADAHPDPRRQAGIDLAMALMARFTRLLPAAEALALARRAATTYALLKDPAHEYMAQYLCWTQELEIDENADRSIALARMEELVQPDWSPLRCRFVRAARAHHERLAGNLDFFMRSSREDLAVFRRLGAQGESWSAAHALMLAEHDQGRPAAALAIGGETVADIRRAGRQRTFALMISMYATMLAESGDAPSARAAVTEALPLLPTMQACEVLILGMAWLAHHEGRYRAAARLLGWFESPARNGGRYGENTFTRRTQAALAARLRAELGDDTLAVLRAEATQLGDAGAVALHDATHELGTGAPADQNPTAS